MATGIQRLDLIDIDLNKDGLIRESLNHVLGKDDDTENQFGVRVFRNGEPEDITGATVTGYFTDPDGSRIVITSGAYANENVAYITLPSTCYAHEGQFRLAIKVTQGGVTSTLRILEGTIRQTYYTTE